MSATPKVSSSSVFNVTSLSRDIRADFERILKEVPPYHFYPVDKIRELIADYSPEDLVKIYQDYCDLKQQTFEGVTKDRDYLVTAGGPASGKSTIEEYLIAGGECPDKSLSNKLIKRAYIDPDRSCLLRMKNTYLADTLSGARTPQQAYEHWRKASNFLSNVFLAIALKEGYAIAHGSTMATPPSMKALQAIKDLYQYNRTVVHVTCDEQIRKESEVFRRKGGIVQCSDKDFPEKQAMFFTLLPEYVKCSDKVIYCYRGSFDRFDWAATAEKGRLKIYDQTAFDKIQGIHDFSQGSGFSKQAFQNLIRE